MDRQELAAVWRELSVTTRRRLWFRSSLSTEFLLVRFSDRRVTFQHLSGPFRAAEESFDVVTLPDGSTALEHRGHFVMRLGLVGWILGRLVVRRMFEALVASHMAQLANGTADASGRSAGRD